MSVRMLRLIFASSLLLTSIVAGDHDLNGESDSGLKQATDSYKNGVSYLGVDRLPEKEAKPEDIDPSAMKFYLYTREAKYPEELKIGKIYSLLNSSYNPSKDTKFLIHGWMLTPRIFTDIVNDYLYVQDFNVIVMDWSMYSKVYNYETTAYVVVPQAGLALARLMRDLTGYGSSPKEHFHAIGVVEGAHIVGIAAKHLSSLRMKRISALDPAGTIYDKPGQPKLENGDAKFVDVMHSNVEVIGSARPIGHLAFHPNGGHHPQPPCPRGPEGVVCSSLITIGYWRESITRPQAFKATRCENWAQYVSHHCPKPAMYTTMGEYANPMVSVGLYYLETNAQKPYSKSP